MNIEPATRTVRFFGHLFDGVILLMTSKFLNISTSLDAKPKESLFLLLLSFLYYFVFEFFTQTTPGKLLVGTQTVTNENKSIGFRHVVVRTLCRNIPFEQLSFLFKHKPVGWHDKFSETKVVLSKDLKDLNKKTLETSPSR